MGLCWPACLACSHTIPKNSKRIRAVPKRPNRSKTLPNSLYAYAYLSTIPYHTRQYHTYGIMLTIQPYSQRKPNIWDWSGNLYQVLHVLQFQTSSFSRCVCVSCKTHVGFCICQLGLEIARFDHWITRASRALVRFYYPAAEVPKPCPNAPKQFPTMLKHNLKNESSQPMKQVT